MKIFEGHLSARGQVDEGSVAIGNFDGVHLGHRTLIEAAAAAPHKGPLIALTFDPHPVKVLKPALAPPLISPMSRRLELLEREGVDVTVVEPFTLELANLAADDFVEAVLIRCLRPAVVTVGYDFTYGRDRQGDVERLSQQLSAAGIEARILAPVCIDGIVVSSTKVREFVLYGQMEGAALLLGRLFSVAGIVVHGAGRGSGMGIKTLNLQTDQELMPNRGVYATWVVLPGQDAAVASVTNVGRNPTFGDEELHIETHVLDEVGDQYGEEVEVRFVARLRSERRFADAAALVSQIRADVKQARAILGERAPGA